MRTDGPAPASSLQLELTYEAHAYCTSVYEVPRVAGTRRSRSRLPVLYAPAHLRKQGRIARVPKRPVCLLWLACADRARKAQVASIDVDDHMDNERRATRPLRSHLRWVAQPSTAADAGAGEVDVEPLSRR